MAFKDTILNGKFFLKPLYNNCNIFVFSSIGIIVSFTTVIEVRLMSSRGLAVMHSTQTNVILSSRPTGDNW